MTATFFLSHTHLRVHEDDEGIAPERRMIEWRVPFLRVTRLTCTYTRMYDNNGSMFFNPALQHKPSFSSTLESPTLPT